LAFLLLKSATLFRQRTRGTPRASDADSTIAFARETTTGGFCWVLFAHPFKRRADDGDDDTDVWTLGEVGWN
jgi:hypothetical protein